MLTERRRRALGVIARSIEAVIHHRLEMPPDGMEGGGSDECRSRHGDRLAARDVGEQRLSPTTQPAKTATNADVTSAQPTVRLTIRSISNSR